jgi:thioredoxin reductase/NAD-dependent dihydropyrimidine dehydrogenase PreA subunit
LSDTIIIWLLGLGLTAVVVLPVVVRLRSKEARTDQAEAEALAYGLNEPASLHPVVDTERCIGTGSCIDVCPEGDVLGLRSGQTIAVAPGCCIGHGLCERACPVEAIRLVFGTATRGVDIPRIKGNFETNEPGIFIVGELGGMGLIRNAFEQGRQCVEGLPGRVSDDLLDLVIVGCGPAGLSAALTARNRGLRYLIMEREQDLGGTVRHYPRKKLVMTTPVEMPGFGSVGSLEIRKEDLIETWQRIGREAELPLHLGQTVQTVVHDRDALEVRAEGASHRARAVILAIGRRGIPRKLGVSGEDLPTVQYSLAEPEAYRGDRILVVGGGDSAVEAALRLADQPDTLVRISYRRDQFTRIKPKNRTLVTEAIDAGRLEVHWTTVVDRIEPTITWLRNEDSKAYSVDVEQLFVFAGGELPRKFLEECGIEVDTKFGES